jgi:hypothetical protein
MKLGLGRAAMVAFLLAVVVLVLLFRGLVDEEAELESEQALQPREHHEHAHRRVERAMRKLSTASLHAAALAAREVQEGQHGERIWCGKHWLYNALGIMIMSPDLPQVVSASSGNGADTPDTPDYVVGQHLRIRLINFLDSTYGVDLPEPSNDNGQPPALIQSLPVVDPAAGGCPPCASSKHIEQISIFAAVNGPESFASIASPILRPSPPSCDCGWVVELPQFTLPGEYDLELRLLNYAGAASFNNSKCMAREGALDGWPGR